MIVTEGATGGTLGLHQPRTVEAILLDTVVVFPDPVQAMTWIGPVLWAITSRCASVRPISSTFDDKLNFSPNW